jgi:hypothetical protein
MRDSWRLYHNHCANTSLSIMCKLTPDEKLMYKIFNGGRKNINDWLKIIVKYYIEDQVVEDRESVQIIKNKFYTVLHDEFLCTALSLLHKFLLDKGFNDIIQYRPPLQYPLPNSNWRERQEKWEELLEANCKDTKEAWD